MKENENQIQKLSNGRDLLRQCVKKLQEGKRGEAGGNRALYPIVVVFMGAKCKEYAQYIKRTLDDNFDNARYLQYVTVEKNGEDCHCSFLKDVENDNYDELVWEPLKEDFKGTIDYAVEQMMSNGNFGDRNSVKIEYIINATEEEGKAYFEMYQNTKCSYNVSVLQTLYLMLDQSPRDGKLQQSELLMRHVVDSYKENRQGTVYMISNNLANGIFLDDNTIWKNYRLIADVMLLGDNQDGDQVSTLYNGIKTVSYTLNTRPSNEIAVVSLQAMLEEMREIHIDDAEKDITLDYVRKQLGMKASGAMELASNLFSEIQSGYPNAQNFMYLPFKSEQEYNEMMKAGAISLGKLDVWTCNAASAYIEMNYVEPVEKYFLNKDKNEKCRNEIRKLIYNRFKAVELCEMAKKMNEFVGIWKNEELSFEGVGTGKDIAQKIHALAVYEGEKKFVANIKEILIEELTEITDAAEILFDNYNVVINEVKKESGAIVYDKNVEDGFEAYRILVRNCIRGAHSTNMSKTSFDDVFKPTRDKADFVNGLWKAFLDLLNCEEFEFDFERELLFRMKDKNDVDKLRVIQDWVNSNPLRDICLNESMKVQLVSKACFYLVNKDADYVQQFEQKRMDGNYSLFYLNRTDSIERLAIYDIANPEVLHLLVEEK